MRQRCFDPKHERFASHGGAGIFICAWWTRFENFWADMQQGWFPHAAIVRQDPKGHYNKANCSWMTRSEQMKKRQADCRPRMTKDEIQWQKKIDRVQRIFKLWNAGLSMQEIGVAVNRAETVVGKLLHRKISQNIPVDKLIRPLRKYTFRQQGNGSAAK